MSSAASHVEDRSTALSAPLRGPAAMDWPRSLEILRDAGAEINRLGPDTSLAEALVLIAQTAVRLTGSDPRDGAAAVIYTYDAERAAFDPNSRVSAGEGERPLIGDVPRAGGVGALALARRTRVLSYEEDSVPFHPLKHEAGIRTAACYPLLVAGQAVGALYIDRRSGRRFTDDELLLLDTLVHLAAVAIYNTRQYEGINRALRRKVDELERLRHAERLISSRLNLDETLREILRAALDLTAAEHGSFRLLDKQTGRLHLRAIEPDWLAAQVKEDGGRAAHESQSGVVGWVAEHRRPARIADLRQPPWAGIYRPLHPRREMRSELAVPLLGPGRGLEGVLNLESPRPAAFDLEAQRVLEALATQAVIAIQEAKLLGALEDVTEQLVSRSPDELFALLIERALDLLNVPHAAVWLVDDAQPPALRLRAANGSFPPHYRVPLEGSLLGTAVRSGRPAVSADLRRDPRVVRPELALQMGWVSALVVPLVVRGRTPGGAFGVYASEPREFSDWDMRLLTCLANHAAVALQQAESLAQVKLAEERQAVAETFAVLGDVSANLLHRVNNLISVIPVQTQTIAARHPSKGDQADLLTRLGDIEASARAAMDAARATMAYLRPLRLQPTAAAVCYQMALSRLTLPPHIRLAAAGLHDLPPVWAGAEQLGLALFNLIQNAVEAIGDRPGRIAVHGRVAEDALDAAQRWVEIIVADDGPGIPPAARAKVFDPNFSTKHSLKKLGFGLWWTKAWIQRCGGSIALADRVYAGAWAAGLGPEANGGGCVFSVRLPVALQATEAGHA